MKQGKHWCFTINNPTEEDDKALTTLQEDLETSDCVYLIYGREKGESGTPHYQGFVSFKKRKHLNWVHKLLGGRTHLEGTKGTPKQAAEYCKKEGDYSEFGQLPGGQGKRTDLEDVAKAIREGKNLKEISEDHPAAFLRYGSGVLRYRQLYRPKRIVDQPQILVLWGETGVGKTRRVWEFVNHDELWVHPGGRWFDGYVGQRAVLFDDFDGGWFKLTYLLKLLDRYTFQVPVKGGYTWWNPTWIYITANQHPKEWYINSHDEHKRALMRRLNEFGNIEHVKALPQTHHDTQ